MPIRPIRSALFRLAATGLLSALALAPCACDSGPSKGSVAAERPKETVTRDVPSILRNTIGSEATIRGVEPMLVSGYGLVVGLNGTGSRDVPLAIRSVMEREMTVLGVGQGIGPLSDISPTQMLEDPNNAVVLVRAVVKPGSPPGTRFDLFVEALPGTSTTSLEGGRLYTCKLYPGIVRPAMPAVRPVGEGKGELFINPFADPAAESEGTVIKTKGRVLNGGAVTEALALQVVLDNASHSRARAVTDAINSRFPRNSNPRLTARGMNDELIEISIPSEYQDHTDEFLAILRHTRIDQQFPKEWANRYVKALEEQPELAVSISWCLLALGDTAIPFVRDLYTFSEQVPRLAAVQAGARLGDITVRPYLEDLAVNGPPATRADSFELLGQLPSDPMVNRFLRDHLDAPDIDARIASYEALAARADPVVQRRRIAGKFDLDLVPSSEPMVYITLQKQPRIVIFGSDPQVERPVFVSAWSDRLMLSAQGPSDRVNVFYRDYKTGRATTAPVKPGLPDLIEYMAHKPTPEDPEPGLDFNYSEVVGALYELIQSGAAPGVFVPESDRLALEIVRSVQTESGADRPETSPDGPIDELPTGPEPAEVSPPAGAGDAGDNPQEVDPAAPAKPAAPSKEGPAQPKRRYVVPLAKPAAPGEGDKGGTTRPTGPRETP